MGKGRKPKSGGKPTRAQRSGEQTGVGTGGGGGIASADQLAVWLVHLDEEVHRRCTIGDAVTVRDSDGELRVFSSSGRLGDVPPQHAEVIRTRGYVGGEITALEAEPLRAQVVLF